jgi:hypothetical protein
MFKWELVFNAKWSSIYCKGRYYECRAMTT